MSLNCSRLLIAATFAAALGAFGAVPALAAGMTSSHDSMTSTQDHMSAGSMATQQNQTTKPRHESAMQKTNSGSMKAQDSMK